MVQFLSEAKYLGVSLNQIYEITMKERNVTVTLDKAKEWFNSGNATLKEIALQAFGKEELVCNFKDITTFKKACEALGLNYDIIPIVTKDVATFSRASAAMFKLKHHKKGT